MDADEVQTLIRQLADPQQAFAARDRLEADLDRVRPWLLDALGDPALLADGADGARPGVTHVLYLLSRAPSDDTLQRVRPLAEHRLTAVRAGVGRVLAVAGEDQDLGRVCALLTDEAERVRAETVVGVALLHESGRASSAYEAAVFAAVGEALRRSERESYPSTPRLLLELDRKRALALFQAPELLRPQVGALRGVLDALVDERVAVPVDPLLALLPELDARGDAAGKYDDPRAPLIELLGAHQGPRVDEVLRRYSTCKNAYTAMTAAELRCRRLGLDPYVALDDDPTSASAPRRTVALCVDFDYQVGNGGFRQFFGNGSGEWAAETVDALRAIGAPRSAELLERAAAEFGADGPPRDIEARRAALTAMRPKAGERTLFDSYDVASDATDEPVMALVYLHALEHPADFRRSR